MKLLLVNPYDWTDKEYGPPRAGLGLAYIVSVIRKEKAAEVKLLDKFAEYRLNNFNIRMTEKEFEKALIYFKPDIVGFSTYTETIADVIKDARRVKEKFPDAIVVIGGAHATAIPEETLRHYDFIDVAVVGEGEFTMLDIVRGIPLEEIKGIVYRNDKKIISNPIRMPPPDIDEIPFPARDMLHMEYYTQPSKEVHARGPYRYASLISSRGCKAGCSFCLQVKVHRRFSAHSEEYVISEIEQILRNYPEVDAIEFMDNLFLSNEIVTENLCRALIKSGLNKRIKWKAQTRVVGISEDILILMKEAGCFMLGFGFESGSQKILDRMNKRITVSDCLKAARLTKKTGIKLEAYFIYGYPDETEEDFLATLHMIEKMQPDFVGYGRFAPVPGTLDYKRLLISNRIVYRYDDSSLDWERVNLYRENQSVNYTKINDERFKELEEIAWYDYVKPINIAQHLNQLPLREIFKLKFMLKLVRKSLIVFWKPKYFIARVKDFLVIFTSKLFGESN